MKKRFKRKPTTILENQWMSSYSDMVSLLLVFFVVLFSMMKVQVNELKIKKNEKEKKVIEESVEIQLRKIILSEKLQDYIEIEQTSSGANIKIKDSLLFDSGSYQINTTNADKLTSIFIHLLSLPKDYEFIIEGHTDNIPMTGLDPSIPTNWHLSTFRAMSVMQLMKKIVKEEKIEMNLDRIGIAGYADLRPKATNDTPEGRLQNRRIEIKVQSKLANTIVFKKE